MAGGGIKYTTNIIRGGADGDTYLPVLKSDGLLYFVSSKFHTEIGGFEIKGNKGDKGDKGDTGSRGLQGERGYTGLLPEIYVPYSSEIILSSNVKTYIGERDEFGGVSELRGDCSIYLDDGQIGVDNEWAFVIKQGDTEYSVELPYIQWGLGFSPTFSKSSTTYCILYDIDGVLCGEWRTVY